MPPADKRIAPVRQSTGNHAHPQLPLQINLPTTLNLMLSPLEMETSTHIRRQYYLVTYYVVDTNLHHTIISHWLYRKTIYIYI